MWGKNFSFREGAAIGCGLLATGALLQAATGSIDWQVVAWPVNGVLLGFFLAALVVMHLLRRKVYFFNWLSHSSSAIMSMVFTVGVTVVLGLIAQSTSVSADVPWFRKITSSWPFVMIYVWLAISLGLTILRRCVQKWNLRNVFFMLNHLGLFIVLMTATLGNADMQRLKMTVGVASLGYGPQSLAQNELSQEGEMVDMDFALVLNKFSIEQYPAKLVVIDSTGKVVTESGKYFADAQYDGRVNTQYEVRHPEAEPKESGRYFADAQYDGRMNTQYEVRHPEAEPTESGRYFADAQYDGRMNTQYEVRHPEAEPKESDGARHPEAEPKDLLEWDIRITEELQTAAKIEVPDPEDTLKTIVKYVPMQLEHQSAIYEGGAYAVYVIATNVVTGETREGWVSCGSFLPFSFSVLPLDSGRSIAMPEREPKRYVSDVTLYVRDGNDAVCLGDRTIEVNHPLDVNGWKIYQTGYEEQLGAASRYSIFEVVRDPWLPLVYLGIFMMLAGALSLFLTSKPKSYQQ